MAATQWTDIDPSLSGTSYDDNVSCVSSTFCVATGIQETGSTGSAIVQAWNGSTWTTQSVPVPSGVDGTSLNGISCTSVSFCVGVGGSYAGAGDEVSQPYAVEWDGSTWMMATGLGLPSGYDLGWLDAVSCIGPAWCMAVGYTSNSTSQASVPIGQQWNGATWSLSPTSATSDGTNSALTAISCTTTTNCMAVGASAQNLAPSVLQGPGSSGASSGGAALPFGIPGAGVPTLGNGDAHALPHAPAPSQVLAEQWNGSSWTISPTVAPSNSTQPEFEGISCAGNGFCMATGFDYGNQVHSFTEEWTGGTWTEVPLPAPPNDGVLILEGVSCISPTACTSVGESTLTPDLSAPVGDYVAGTWNGSTWTTTTVTPPAGTDAAAWIGVSCLSGGFCVATGARTTGPQSNETFVATNAIAPVGRFGYRLAASDGGVFTYGPTPPDLGAPFLGSMGGAHLNAPIVGTATMPSGDGYYLVASDGGVFNFGSAAFYGSAGGTHLNAPIVGMAVTADGGGYWLVASDGGIFSYGDAQFYGSSGGTHLNKPIVGMAATPNGRGYYLVAADGGVFTYGNAVFAGSAGGTPLNQPIVGMAVTSAGGYYLAASDGGVFSYGGAPFLGSGGRLTLNKPVVGIGVAQGGYYLVASDGGVFAFPGFGAPPMFFGSAGGTRLQAPVVGIGV